VSVNFAERIAQDYQLKQYEDLKNRWYNATLSRTDKVKGKLYGLLRYPMGGWMVDMKQSQLSSENITSKADRENIEMEEDSDEMTDDENGSELESDYYEEENDEDNTQEDSMNLDMDESDFDSVMSKKGKENSRALQNKRNQLKKRKRQLIALRRLYLPNLCFVLIDMLSKMDLNTELIRVNDVITSETYGLASLFEKNQLKSFLSKVADTSIALLDAVNEKPHYK
jgi:hypothetical protein